jgi:nitrous oxidase accessory protein NosD
VRANTSTLEMVLRWLDGDFPAARDAAVVGFRPTLQTRHAAQRACQE